MASILGQQTANERKDLGEETVAAVVDSEELTEAQKDPRVRSFLDESDAYLADLEQQGRSR